MTSTPLAQSTPVVINRPSATSVGTIVWLASEVMFFAGLFAMYFSLRANAPEIWANDTQILDVQFALINTLILVASSFTAQFGVFAAERMQPRATGKSPAKWGLVEWFFISYVLGAIFVAGQVYEYAVLVSEGITISSNSYGSAFYITTGFHALHVTGDLSPSCCLSERPTLPRSLGTLRRPARLLFLTTGTSSMWFGSACS